MLIFVTLSLIHDGLEERVVEVGGFRAALVVDAGDCDWGFLHLHTFHGVILPSSVIFIYFFKLALLEKILIDLFGTFQILVRPLVVFVFGRVVHLLVREHLRLTGLVVENLVLHGATSLRLDHGGHLLLELIVEGGHQAQAR